ncbi:MAG: 50S ribosomal protein L4 [Candidatus Omnitrophica bacterium]|nr:50S ribosomal protein L4 [Candidatus Omnitrophota bacterium]
MREIKKMKIKRVEKKMTEVKTRLSVYDLGGKVVDHINLDEKIFDGRVNKTLLYEAKKMYEANKRQCIGVAKTRAEVSGGGAKPWRQKGTGRARVGSSRNPIWRHGGAAFGPRPRDFGYLMPKKAARGALISSLNARLKENGIKPVVKMELSEAKTKVFSSVLSKLKVDGKILVVVDKMSPEVKRASGNLKNVSLMEGRNINARDVLLNECIVVEKEALLKLVERLK